MPRNHQEQDVLSLLVLPRQLPVGHSTRDADLEIDTELPYSGTGAFEKRSGMPPKHKFLTGEMVPYTG